MSDEQYSAHACPIREYTANRRPVGRCWFHLEDGKTCPRHGDVSAAVKQFVATGKLTDEPLERTRP